MTSRSEPRSLRGSNPGHKDVPTYHNTVPEHGELLKKYQLVAGAQDERVFAFFLKRPGKRFSPSQVHLRVFSPSVPLTSVRRAMTNLANKGLLVKTERKRMGRYGRDECTWMLND